MTIINFLFALICFIILLVSDVRSAEMGALEKISYFFYKCFLSLIEHFKSTNPYYIISSFFLALYTCIWKYKRDHFSTITSISGSVVSVTLMFAGNILN